MQQHLWLLVCPLLVFAASGRGGQPVDGRGHVLIRKVPVRDCRVLRAFVGTPVDGCLKSRDYGGRVAEYPGRVGPGIRYRFNNNDGVHVSLARGEEFNVVVLRGGAGTRMYADADDIARPGNGRHIWSFPGGP